MLKTECEWLAVSNDKKVFYGQSFKCPQSIAPIHFCKTRSAQSQTFDFTSTCRICNHSIHLTTWFIGPDDFRSFTVQWLWDCRLGTKSWCSLFKSRKLCGRLLFRQNIFHQISINSPWGTRWLSVYHARLKYQSAGFGHWHSLASTLKSVAIYLKLATLSWKLKLLDSPPYTC